MVHSLVIASKYKNDFHFRSTYQAITLLLGYHLIKMIRDGTVFDDDHLPRTIVERDPEMNEVTGALAPIERDLQAENCFLFGPSGVGKTTVARAAVRELRREVLEVPYTHVNCWRNYSKHAVLEEIALNLVNIPVSRNASTIDLNRRIQDSFEGPGVVILDEIDQLEEPDLLYDLDQIRGLSCIAIANREIDLFAGLEDRVRSRVSAGYRVTFDRYSEQTIIDILDRRAREGLTPHAVSDRVLEEIALRVDGDARTAIRSLRVAANKSIRKGLSSIDIELVDESTIQAKGDIQRKAISKLNQHQRVVHEIVSEQGPIMQKELYDRYRDQHADPVSLRYLRKKHLPKLLHYNLVECEKNGTKKLYRSVTHN